MKRLPFKELLKNKIQDVENPSGFQEICGNPEGFLNHLWKFFFSVYGIIKAAEGFLPPLPGQAGILPDPR